MSLSSKIKKKKNRQIKLSKIIEGNVCTCNVTGYSVCVCVWTDTHVHNNHTSSPSAPCQQKATTFRTLKQEKGFQ